MNNSFENLARKAQAPYSQDPSKFHPVAKPYISIAITSALLCFYAFIGFMAFCYGLDYYLDTHISTAEWLRIAKYGFIFHIIAFFYLIITVSIAQYFTKK